MKAAIYAVAVRREEIDLSKLVAVLLDLLTPESETNDRSAESVSQAEPRGVA